MTYTFVIFTLHFTMKPLVALCIQSTINQTASLNVISLSSTDRSILSIIRYNIGIMLLVFPKHVLSNNKAVPNSKMWRFPFYIFYRYYHVRFSPNIILHFSPK